MAQKLTSKKSLDAVVVAVDGSAEVKRASDEARNFAAALGFTSVASEEIALAVTELASNLVKHAERGKIVLSALESGGRGGMQIISEDNGPGIPDVERAMTDGYSTNGSLGAGLGAINRLMDALEFSPLPAGGLRIICERWVRPPARELSRRWLEVGAASRACSSMPENGDAFVLSRWEGHALMGIIDGLGHGQLAHVAAEAARQYVEHHFDQPLDKIFCGAGRACRATRGVVMALARFEQARQKFTLASVGNVEVRLVRGEVPFKPVVRRGIVGLSSAPKPVLTEHAWKPNSLLVMHSDGLKSGWKPEDVFELGNQAAAVIARRLLEGYGRPEDDATVVVARSANS